MQEQDLLKILDSLPGSRKLWMRLVRAVVAYRIARKKNNVTGKETNGVMAARAHLLRVKGVAAEDVKKVIAFVVRLDSEGRTDVLFDLEGQ